MKPLKKFYFVFFLFIPSSCLFFERKKIEGYKFPVYSTEYCPRNETEWKERSIAINCTQENGYVCLPNRNITELFEFCFTLPFILIEEGICLYLEKNSEMYPYNCSNFRYGCPNSSHVSYELFDHRSCTSIGNGCFLEDPLCESLRTTTTTLENINLLSNTMIYNWIWIITFSVYIFTCFSCSLFIYLRKGNRDCIRYRDIESRNKADPLPLIPLISRRDTDTKEADEEDQNYKGSGCVKNQKKEELYNSKSISPNEPDRIISTPQGNRSCIRHGDAERHVHVEVAHSLLLPQIENEKKESTEKDQNYKVRGCVQNQKKEELYNRNSISPSEPDLIKYSPQVYQQETRPNQITLEDWEKENKLFVPTRACEEVEKRVNSQNLVIVTGHSGSGKSAIIQHIALKYKSKGWTVKPIYEIMEIIQMMNSTEMKLEKKTFFVFNDPIGKASIDKIENDVWKKYDENLRACLKIVKLLLSCRKYILFDDRVDGILKKKSSIIDVSNDDWKVNKDEKRRILRMHASNKTISVEELEEVVKIDSYFPLLCKLYCESDENDILGFFKEPIAVFEKEIRNFRLFSIEKYCALVLLVLFNNGLCVEDILESQKLNEKFKSALILCGLNESTAPSTFIDILNTFQGFFVKRIGDTFYFYHDFVMEVTSFVFGKYYPTFIIENADTGFLRKRVRLDCDEEQDQFTISLSDKHIGALGKRLYDDIFGNRLLDVVLNPCFKNDNVTNVIIEELKHNPQKLEMLFQKKYAFLYRKEDNWTSNKLFLSKLAFLNFENQISPLFAIIVFGNTKLSLYCLTAMQRIQSSVKDRSIFSAICCNGSLDLFFMFMGNQAEECISEKFDFLFPIHITSVFHNYEILNELIKVGVDVNLKTDSYNCWTPLTLAAGNDTDEGKEKKNNSRRDNTVQLLLDNKADINLCGDKEATPLSMACQGGYDSTVQLLLKNGADINLYSRGGISPLYIACQNGYIKTVQILLQHRADIDVRTESEVTPVCIACINGYKSIVHLLLENGANINLSEENGASPLCEACKCGHEDIVQLLLSNGADLNVCMVNGASPLNIACLHNHLSIVKKLLYNGANINRCTENGISPLHTACNNGHNESIELLLSNGADINGCMKNGGSPLFIACLKGKKNTVQLLLTKGADIDLCLRNGASPLFATCQMGYYCITELLLNKGADINLCTENGESPLLAACENFHDNIVQLLLNAGADTNISSKNIKTPLFVACKNGYHSIVQCLLNNEADINLCTETGEGPLFTACENGHDKTVELLLESGANINMCSENEITPLFIACEKGHKRIVQMLLNNGADINCSLTNGYSPLHKVCLKGHYWVAELLLRKRADINLGSRNGSSPLFIACVFGRDDLVDLLLSHNANINLSRIDGTSPLSIACQYGHKSTVELLLKKGADINLCRTNGVSPIAVACLHGHDSIVHHLLSKGADIHIHLENGAQYLYKACQYKKNCILEILLKNTTTINITRENLSTALLIACLNGHESTVQVLLNYGADINFRLENNVTALVIACEKGHDRTVKHLLSNGADSNICMENGAGPLHMACKNGFNIIVQLLLEKVADVNLRMKIGRSPLCLACENGQENTVKLLLQNKANTNAGSSLFLACYNGYMSIVDVLLSHGADINQCTEDGASPLYAACENGNESIVVHLIRNGADINLCSEDGTNPLYLACENGYESIVVHLLNNGADINLCLEDGTSPLHIACENGHEFIIEHLLVKGIQVNLCKKDGMSPLYISCNNEHHNVAQLLLSKGADMNLCYKDGLSPLMAACFKGYDSIVQLLLNHGADINLCSKDGYSPLLFAAVAKNCSILKTILKIENETIFINGCDFKGFIPR